MFDASCFALLVEEILGAPLKMFDASCFALLVEEILGGPQKEKFSRCCGLELKELGTLMFDASCFALLVEEILEVARGGGEGRLRREGDGLVRLLAGLAFAFCFGDVARSGACDVDLSCIIEAFDLRTRCCGDLGRSYSVGRYRIIDCNKSPAAWISASSTPSLTYAKYGSHSSSGSS